MCTTSPKCVLVCTLCVYCVGVAEKITGTGNVDTINSKRNAGTVSLMLFSSTTHQKGALASFVCESV